MSCLVSFLLVDSVKVDVRFANWPGRVRREDLRASDESSWSDSEEDAELEARLNAQIAKSLGLDESAYRMPKPQTTTTTLPVIPKPQVNGQKDDDDEELSSDAESEPHTPAEDDDAPPNDGAEAEEEEGYSFRLFSTAGPAPKVVLEDDSKVEEGKLLRGRPLSYYIVTDISPEKKQQYEMAAVSGEDVIARSKVRAWGLELPWRVQTIKVTRKAGAGEGGKRSLVHVEDEQPAKRKRPGKKRRVAMRTKARAEAVAQEAAKQKMADKEEHLKEKKKRLNRLKKLRKRAKKKAGKGGGESEEDSSDEE